MVTTVANAVSAVTGPAGVSAATSANTAGQADSEFSQLLDGMDADATTVAATVVNSLPGKALLADADTTVTDAGNLTAEILAMCATPMAAPTPVQIPALIAAGASGQQVVNQVAAGGKTTVDVLAARPPVSGAAADGLTARQPVATDATEILPTNTATPQANAAALPAATAADTTNAPVALTPDTDVAADAAVTNSDTKGGVKGDAGAAGTLTTQDMQWLRTGTQIASGDAAPAQQTKGFKAAATVRSVAIATAATTTTTEAAATAQLAASPVQHEGVYQQLLTQTAPLVAMATGQRFERELEAAKTDSTIPADAASVLNGVATQPAGTQLATDTMAFDASPRHQIHAAVGSHQWATELGDKLTMLATKDTQSATLYMSPADLGPVQVRIDLHQNQASVWFTAEHADTRSALEQSLPRLREMFTAQGMSLTDAGVFGDRSRQQPNYSSAETGSASGMRFLGEEASESISSVRGISLSLLDAYA